jgi:hypothetical protein
VRNNKKGEPSTTVGARIDDFEVAAENQATRWIALNELFENTRRQVDVQIFASLVGDRN